VEGVDRPKTLVELQACVRRASRLPVTGGRMSKTALIEGRGGRALDMSGMNAILHTGADDVLVHGGITLYDLSRALYTAGRQLPGFTITANPSIGGSITAPTKGINHPFTEAGMA
jgi:FAD/FMN-containing dehydrogenase